jgi:transposase
MEKRFTQAQVDLALRKEQLIVRVERGESLETVSQELGLAYHPKHVSRLRRRYLAGGRHWVALVDGREGGQATKITREVALWIVGELQHNLHVTASRLCDELRCVFDIEVSKGRMRQLAIGLGRQGQPGRPRLLSQPAITSAEPLIIEQTQHAGIFFPARGPLADGDPACPDARVGKVQSPILPARCNA